MTQHLFARALNRRRGLMTLGLAATLGTSLLLGGCGTRDAAPPSTFVLLDGSTTTTADLKGKVMLVNFWATTCVSCVQEMPDLVTTHHKFQSRGFDTVAVAMSYDPPAWVMNFAQSRKLPFKVAIDNTGAVSKAWGDIRVTPTTFLVDQQGKIVKRYVGPPNFEALHTLLDGMLAKA